MVIASSEEAATADVDAGPQARWRAALHESGHVVAGRRLLGRTTRAAVFADGGGIADMGGGSPVPQSDAEALSVAAGIAAGVLADNCPPPQVLMSPPVETRYPQLAARLKTERQTIISDDTAIARWCIEGVESRPHRWARRHDWIHDQAASFVDAHKLEIFEVATALFGRGVITLPAEPAKGESHVG